MIFGGRGGGNYTFERINWKDTAVSIIAFFFLILGSIQAFSIPGIIIGPILLTLFYSLWEIYKVLVEYNAAPFDENPEEQ